MQNILKHLIPDALKIIIVGCGKVGRALTEKLSMEGHDITIIDRRMNLVQELSNKYDVMGMVGNGASYSVQREAGVENTDLIIAVTGSDELNLLCCTIARKVGKCAAIARVRHHDYSAELSYLRIQLGLSLIINPELEAAREIARLLRLPSALSINSFARGHAEMVKFKIPQDSKLDGMKISALGQELGKNILVCAVEHGGSLMIPDGSFILQARDEVSFVATPRNSQTFFRNIGLETKQIRSTMIIGGGKSSYYLAAQLLGMGVDVKIIEISRERCEELTMLLPDATIICGDGSDEDLLKEEGIDQIESFVPLTGIDEENILLTLYAKRIPDIKVVTKINRITFNDVIDNLELGSVVYPRYITAEMIIGYVRAMQNSIGSNIETLYHIFDGRAEAIEFHVEASSPVIGIPLKDLPTKDNLLITCINRNGQILIPRGQDSIQMGDTVVIVTTHTGFRDIGDIIR